VGRALYSVLSPHYEVEVKDIEPKEIEPGFDVMHVCIRYSDDFLDTVRRYVEDYRPGIVDVCSTVPPGTCAILNDDWEGARRACHSTTRGLHPNLETSLKTFTKYVSGPKSKELAAIYEGAGIKCKTYERPETTELAHPLSNAFYGAMLKFTDEMAALCRFHGVDFMEAVLEYNKSHNEGYKALDHESKIRPLLYPPHGKIGGHCVTHGAEILLNSIPEEMRDKFPMLAGVK
jgi:UDP-N-acetyl-D-mannosaminuronate dehydrogenase